MAIATGTRLYRAVPMRRRDRELGGRLGTKPWNLHRDRGGTSVRRRVRRSKAGHPVLFSPAGACTAIPLPHAVALKIDGGAGAWRPRHQRRPHRAFADRASCQCINVLEMNSAWMGYVICLCVSLFGLVVFNALD
jgi:hypothetical protein